jgi:hypothetical protein
MEGRIRTPELAPLAWHDNPIHGLCLGIGGPETGDWRSDLVLDIDHIVSWACGTETPFLVGPATLAFHHAGDLRLAVDCGDTGGQVALHELSIDRISQEPVPDQKVCLDRPYYRWRIELNWPKGGVIGSRGDVARPRGRSRANSSDRVPAALHRRPDRADGCSGGRGAARGPGSLILPESWSRGARYQGIG